MSWADNCGNCGSHRADCDCGDFSIVATKDKKKSTTNMNETLIEKEQSLIEEGKITPLKKETIIAITPSFKTRLLEYLESRPYKEVDLLVQGLKATNPFEVSFNGK